MPWTRIISGAIAISVALTAIVLGGWAFTIVFGALVCLGLQEYLIW
jgi:phosphatidate cytidylyltransferase